MQSIRELMEISAHVPTTGYSQELWQLAAEGLDRQEAMQRWVDFGRTPGSFYKAYKALRDDLVRLAFLDRNGRDLEGRRFDMLERWKVVQQLMIKGMKIPAIDLAADMLTPAVRLGMTEVALGVAELLEGHYGAVEIDTRRYLKYRKLRRELAVSIAAEAEVKALKALLVHSIKRKKDLRFLEPSIKALAANATGTMQYMRFRFTTLSAWYELKGDFDQLAVAIRQTMSAYESGNFDVPSAWLSNLYFSLTPILAKGGCFAEAEAHLSKALKLSKPGTQNWHLFMLQRACLGFESGKPGMVRAALKLATKAPNHHRNKELDACWEKVVMLLEGDQVEDVWKQVF